MKKQKEIKDFKEEVKVAIKSYTDLNSANFKEELFNKADVIEYKDRTWDYIALEFNLSNIEITLRKDFNDKAPAYTIRMRFHDRLAISGTDGKTFKEAFDKADETLREMINFICCVDDNIICGRRK